VADFASIVSALNSIKVASDIAKVLRESDLSIATAELKLKLADMIGALADARIEITDIQDLLKKKEVRIAELEDAFQSKDGLVKHYDAYYEMDGNGKPTGEPYCVACWQVRHKKYHLQHVPSESHHLSCVSCSAVYSDRFARTIVPSNVASQGSSHVIVQR